MKIEVTITIRDLDKWGVSWNDDKVNDLRLKGLEAEIENLLQFLDVKQPDIKTQLIKRS